MYDKDHHIQRGFESDNLGRIENQYPTETEQQETTSYANRMPGGIKHFGQTNTRFRAS